VALAFAAAALLSCWNPFAAPVGLALGLASALLGLRALRRAPGSRRAAAAALAAGALAAAASLAVLILTAGAVTGDLPGEPVARGRTQAEAAALLDEEAKRTAADRARAARELEKAGPGPGAGGTAKEDAPLQRGPGVPRRGARDEAQ
jgi:hypothetical protein